MLTSVWCRRSSSTRSFVSFRSSVFSTRAATVLILIFCSGAEKSALNVNVSSRLMSRPAGCFLRILYFAQASDCRLRWRSVSGIAVADLMSYRTDGGQQRQPLWHDREPTW